MARWQRDPAMRRKMAYLLVVVEVVALTINFYPIACAYLYQANIRLGGSATAPLVPISVEMALEIAGSGVCLALAVVVGLMYVRGRAWARLVFMVANGAMVALGLFWFVHNRAGGVAPDPAAAIAGLLLPIVTLFPLMWPLLTFHPVEEQEDA